MKRFILILVLGVLSGVGAHQAWFLARKPVPTDTLEQQLQWMRVRLHLDADQYARIKALHEQFQPRLDELGREVAQARTTSEAFEQRRRDLGQVDFLAYAQFIQHRRTVGRQASESTRALVDAALSVMTPDQRQRYLEMVTPVLEDSASGTFD